MADNGIQLKLDIPKNNAAGSSCDFGTALEVISFSYYEGINRLYRLELLIGLDLTKPGTDKVDVGAFMGRVAHLQVKAETSALDYDTDAMATAGTASPEEFIDGSSRDFTGHIVESKHLGNHFAMTGDKTPQKSFYYIVAVPNAWYMNQSQRTTTYMSSGDDKLTPKAMIEKVMGRYKEGEADQVVNYTLDAALDNCVLKDGPRNVVQYRESDHVFLVRWLERQGWFYLFQPGKRGMKPDEYVEEKMLITSNPKLERLGLGKSQFIRHAPTSASKMGLTWIHSSIRQYPKQIGLHDYNPDTPCVDLVVKYPEKPRDSGLPPRVLENEYYDTPAEGKALAQVRMETYEANAEVFDGAANFPGIETGLSFLPYFALTEDDKKATAVVKDQFKGKWTTDSLFVVEAKHSATATRVDPSVVEAAKAVLPTLPPVGYSVSFKAVRYRETYHPERSAAWPKITETVSAVVLPLSPANDKVAADVYGKYFVYIPGGTPMPSYAGDPGSIGPLRALQSDTEREGGSGVVIAPGAEVLLTFRNGNPDRGAISGSIPNKITKTVHYANMTGTVPDASSVTKKSVLPSGYFSPFSNAKTADGHLDVSMAETIKVQTDGGSKDAYVLSTFLETKTLTLDSKDAGMVSSKGLFSNSFSVGNSADNWELIGIIETLQKQVMAMKSVASQHTKIDYYTNESISLVSDMVTRVMAITKVAKLVYKGSVALLDKERMAIIANPGGAKIATRAIFTDTKSRVMNLTKISLQFVTELKVIHDNVMASVKMGKELLCPDIDVRDARDNNEKKKTGTDKNGIIPDSPARSFRNALIHGDYWLGNLANFTNVVKDFLMIVKLLRSIWKTDVGNSGIRIQAASRSLGKSAGREEANAIQSILNPLPKTVNFEKDVGLNLQLLSDGPMRFKSEDGLYIAAFKEGMDAFTKEPKSLKAKSVIQMGNSHDGGKRGHKMAWKSSLRLAAGDVIAHGGTLSLASDGGRTIVGAGQKIGKYAGLSLESAGGFRLSSTAVGTVLGTKGLHAATDKNFSLMGGSLTLGATSAGIAIGFVDKSSGAVNASKPYIGLAAMSKANVAKALKAKVGLLAKEKAYTEKHLAWRAAKEEASSMGERVAVLADEYAKDGNPVTFVMYGKELATFKLLTAKESKAKAALDKAKAECDKALIEVKSATGSSENANLELTNGAGGKQSIVLSKKSVEVGSDKDVNLKAGGTAVKLNTSGGVNMNTSGKVKINGSMVNIC